MVVESQSRGSTSADASQGGERNAMGSRLLARVMSPDLSLPILILALFAATAVIEPSFLQLSNLQNILRQMAVLLVLACAAGLVLISGGLDLSVGAVAGAAGVVASLTMLEQGPLVGILVGLAFGAFVGLINGFVIAQFDVSPFIVTLGMLSVAEGFSLVVTGGLPVYGLPTAFTDPFSYGSVLGIPMTFIIAIGTLGLFTIVLSRTVFGKNLYAIGGNRMAANLAGVPVKRNLVAIYAGSGLLAGLAGLLLTGRVAAAQPTAGIGLELEAIAAVIIGGVALTGGYGKARHALYGVLLLTLLSNSMNLLSVPSNAQLMVIGTTIIVAVVADRFRRSQ